MSADKLNIQLNIKGTHLQDQLNELARQKSTQIQQKIDRALEKQKHIIRIQQELEQRLRQKNQSILQKLNKSVEAKKKVLDKRREKVHIKLKFETEKSVAHRKKQESLANRSWRQSIKLSEWVNNRNLTKSNRFKSSKIEKLEQLEEKEDKVSDLDKIKLSEHLPQIKQRKSKDQDIKGGISDKYRTIDSSRSKSENNMQPDDMNKSFSYVNKLKQRHLMKEEEEITNFNLKLRKLEQARMKKQKMQKEKQKKIHDLMQFKVEKIVEKKKGQKKSKTEHQRTKTQGGQLAHVAGSNKRQIFKKWEDDNKLRQIQLFEIRLRKGEDYLMGMKDKSMKTKISKQLELSSIQKKLYIQRKSLHQLAKSTQKL